MRHRFPFVLAVACLSIAGCVRTPKSLCQEYVDSLNDMLSRCGITDERPIDAAWPDGRVGCQHATGVSDAEHVIQVCIPWAQEVECSAVEITSSGDLVLPAGCDQGTFTANAR